MNISAFSSKRLFRFAATLSAGQAIFLFSVFTAPAPLEACSVCGCSLSSDWALQGYRAQPGWQFGLRYEYYEQDQLRSGRHAVDRADLEIPNEEEIQQNTLNRSLWMDIDYSIDPAWGINVQVPYYSRFHTTIAEGDSAISTSRANGFGDLRVMGRFQQFSLARSFGLQFGLKLPTGRFNQTFVNGPQAGEILDRGLQLGTGTTDALIGLSYFSRPTVRIGLFGQVVFDQPLNSREEFKPGQSLSLNGGIRFLTTGWLTPQFQLNARWDGRETGLNADYDNSGDTLVYASPGLTAEIGTQTHAFLFVQLPVYQRVNGLQLLPRWLTTIGLTYKL